MTLSARSKCHDARKPSPYNILSPRVRTNLSLLLLVSCHISLQAGHGLFQQFVGVHWIRVLLAFALPCGGRRGCSGLRAIVGGIGHLRGCMCGLNAGVLVGLGRVAAGMNSLWVLLMLHCRHVASLWTATSRLQRSSSFNHRLQMHYKTESWPGR
jgi:hypothetical protein